MRRALSLLLVAVLALGGLAAIAVGVAQRTVWLPDDEVTARASLPDDVPLAITEPGVLETRDGPATVTVRAADPDQPTVVAVGRERDVLAWVEGAAYASIGGLVEDGRLGVETVVGETTVPDPAGSDLWIAEETGTGGATFSYDPPDGRWLLLTASGGTTPGPAELTVTWPRDVTTPWSMPLIVAGVLLLVAALGLLVLLRSRGVLGSGHREDR